jgi:tetratricopeptide (TPR) repeat protein
VSQIRRVLLSLLVTASLVVPLRAQSGSTDAMIQSRKIRVQMYPNDHAAYDGLGAAYIQKGRETGDADYYERAKVALTKSLDLLSNDPAAASAMTHLAVAYMAEHRFDDAFTWAQNAISAGSGDLSPWAIAGDALADKGEYARAAEAYANLQSASGSRDEKLALTYERDSRDSFLRFVAGDTDRAIDLTQEAILVALEIHMPAENLAWSEFQLGEEFFQIGDYKSSAAAYLLSLDYYPSYYRALGGLAKVRAAQGNLPAAVDFYKKALAVVPFPEYAAALGDVYQKLAEKDEARKQHELVEFIGYLSRLNQQIHNRDLALFYADHDMKLTESVDLARRELEVRRDIYTWDVLAWSLYKHGDLKEAGDAISHALQQGTKDAQILFHAGMIYDRLGDSVTAKRYLRNAIQLNPQFHVMNAEVARITLERLDRAPGVGKNESRDEASR